MARYAGLNRAQLSYEYLHTNSTTHEFLFGAIVEMVDNAKDAQASSCAIFAVDRPELRGGRILCFLDDGVGMTREEAHAITTFGYSAKRRDPTMIGQYGNGLKSGAMRIGKDFLIFTKKDDQMTCIFLSRTFHEDEQIDEIIVPAPSFTLDGEPLVEDLFKHNMEMEIICKYSPFHTLETFREQFNLLNRHKSGTLVMVYNLKLLESGEPELDFESDRHDIRLSDPDGGDRSLVPERSSLRAYLSVLYVYPHMKLYINGKKVLTRSIIAGLYKPRQYKFTSTRFKSRAEQQIEELREVLRSTQSRAKEAEMKLKDFEKKNGTGLTTRDLRAQLRKLQDDVSLNKSEIQRLKQNTDLKIRQLKEPKSLGFMFGINVENRSHDGCFIYNNGRLIKMYEKAGPQCDANVRGGGVVGLVDVPFTIMEPTHNKQDFADSREYRQLIRNMGEHLEQYWKDINLAALPGGLVKFWEQFGYLGGISGVNWTLPPVQEERYLKKRLMSVYVTLQCDTCLKWRLLPYDSRFLKDDWPMDNWTCANNKDPANNNCRCPEKPIQIPFGKLEKEKETVEEKREKIEQQLEKQKAELAKLDGLSSMKSRKDFLEAERKRKEEEAERQREAAASTHSQRSRQQQKRPAPGTPPVTHRSSPRNPTARRAKSPIPEPPPKKPRTKADLRRQLQTQKRPMIMVVGDDDDYSEEDLEEQHRVVEPPPKQLKSPSLQQEDTTPSSVAKRNAKKSIAISKASQEDSASTESVSTVGARKSDVQIVEAHSTERSESDSLPTASPRDNQTLKASTSATSPVIVQDNETNSTVPRTSSSGIEVEKHLRKIMYYFAPPSYKDKIGKMTADQLMELDLTEFFKAYEISLMSIVGEHQKAAEKAQKELKGLRDLCGQFLVSQGIALPDLGTGSITQALKNYLKKDK